MQHYPCCMAKIIKNILSLRLKQPKRSAVAAYRQMEVSLQMSSTTCGQFKFKPLMFWFSGKWKTGREELLSGRVVVGG